jgi:DNA-binding response OmpR family regulator
VVYDRESVLEVAEVDPPDVALIDVGLAGLEGHTLLRRLREGHAARLIATTTRTSVQETKWARFAGFDECFVKPLDLAMLARAVG